jgi:serine/threonine protein kinase
VNLADSNGSTALHEAVAKNQPEIVKCLIEEGADPAKENHNGQTANDFALSKKLPNIKEMLDRAPEILKLRLEARKAEEAEEAEKQRLSSSQSAAAASAPPPPPVRAPEPAPPQKMAEPIRPSEYPADVNKLSWSDIEFAEIDPIIGEGSFGIVYRGKYYPESRRDRDGIDVAIKVMSSIMVPTQKDYELIRATTLQEAATVKHITDKVNPDSVVNLIGVVEGAVPTAISKLRNFELKQGDETVLGIVMKYEGGGSLEDLLYKSGRILTLDEKIRILVGIAFSIAELHGARPNYFIHGDIKPDNILLSSDWPPVVKLTDFGLADTRRAVIDSMGAVQVSVLRTTLAKQGNTPIYSAPEILPSFETGEPTHSHSRTSDMYAFGLVAWELLSGEKPFGDASNFIQFVYKVQSGQRPDMAKLPSDLPLAVKDMIMSLLNPDRLRRMTASACFSVLNHTYSKLCSDQFDIVFSHPWVNKGILRHVYRLLTDQGYRIWFDEFDHGYDLKEVLDKGVRKSAVVLACVNESYQKSADCMQELKAVAEEHGKPVITLLTQSNDSKWASTELRRLCSFPEKKSVDVSAAAEMLNKDGDPVDWENPDDTMMSKLEGELHPLYRILKEMRIPHSLLAQDGAPEQGLLRRKSSGEDSSPPMGDSGMVEEEIWKIIHDDRLLLNPAGMKTFLEENGLVEIEFLSLCDETTFNDMKSFVKLLPRKKLEKLIGEMNASCH